MQGSGAGMDSSVFASPATQGKAYYSPDSVTSGPAGECRSRSAKRRTLQSKQLAIDGVHARQHTMP